MFHLYVSSLESALSVVKYNNKYPINVLSLIGYIHEFSFLMNRYWYYDIPDCLFDYSVHYPEIGQDLAKIATFAMDVKKREEPLLVHCMAGLSRSPAIAWFIQCLLNPDVSEKKLLDDLIKSSSLVKPNPSIIVEADKFLNRNGRMIQALKDSKLENVFNATNLNFNKVFRYNID
jgi:hypothetical protein